MRTQRKFLSILLALSMLLSLLPVTALADGEESSNVAAIGSQEYGTLSAAISAASSGDTVKLLSAVSAEGNITVSDSTSITLDLNGQELDLGSYMILVKGGTLTVTDSTVEGEPSVGDVSDYTVTYTSGVIKSTTNVVQATDNGVFTLESGKIQSSNDSAVWAGVTGPDGTAGTVNVTGGYILAQEFGIATANGGTINVSGGVVEAKDNAVLGGNGTKGWGNYTINLTGGTLIGRITTDGYASCGIYHPNEGTVNVSGGTIISTKGAGIVARAGQTNVTGGTIIALGDDNFIGKVGDSKVTVSTSGIVLDLAANYPGAKVENGKATNADVTVSNDAEISGTKSAVTVVETYQSTTVSEDDNVVITDGTFSDDVSDYLPSGMTATKDEETGKYTIAADEDAKASIGEAAYATLEDAIAAAQSGDTITLLTDVEVTNSSESGYGTSVVNVPDGVTLDGNGHKITAKDFTQKDSKNNNSIVSAGIGATIQNLTIVGGENTKHGINIYNAGSEDAPVIISNVTIQDCAQAGITVNGSYVEAENITTSGNAWGGINVDQASTFTLTQDADSVIGENLQIWSDDANNENGSALTIKDDSLIGVTGVGENLKGFLYYTSDVSNLGAAYNETTSTVYESLADALDAAEANDTISVVKDTALATDDEVPENVTLVIEEGVTLTIGEEGGGTLTNKGTITNNGTINGTVTGTDPVVPVTGVTLDKESLSLTEGGTASLTAAVEPENASNQNVTWTSSDEEVATVDSEGIVTAVSEGEATITVTTEDGNKTATCAVTVNAATVSVTGVTLDQTTLPLTVGGTASLTAAVEPENASNQNVTWTSSDEEVATVDSDGIVTAVGVGEATITVTTEDGNKTATCAVTVEAAADEPDDPTPDDPTEVTVTLDKASLSLTVGGSADLTYTVSDDTAVVMVDNSNPEVVEISVSGNQITVTAVAKGTATITVTAGDVSASCTVTVTKKSTSSGSSASNAGSFRPASTTKPGETPTTPATPTQTHPFVDVKPSDWYSAAAQYVYEKGLMAGISATEFGGGVTTTRGMIATMLYSLEGGPRTGTASFSDVSAGQYYASPVAWATANGVVAGYGDGRFGPNDTITREQLALILYNYAALKGYNVSASASLSGYLDGGETSAWAVHAMEWAVGANLLSGRGGGILAPGGSATRAEVAQILMNFCENVAE